MQMNLRTLIAILIAPLFPAMLLISLSLITNASRSGLGVGVFASIFFGYIGFFLFGVPSIFILQKNNLLTVLNLALCASIFGVLVYGVFLFLFSLMMGVSVKMESLGKVFVGGVLGAGIAFFYGLIAGVRFK
ncbi:hypothetical protein [Diaphorobacter aerolatus]|uniref:Uncharacterized protein n=1 Tax=Diaphorobacter aerolatus TaxID=1288495 RepID=A0A7H0GGK4_9BURK|nr:hypothetical protein [Diaphorobacter aerolatus]QNP47420.1 hypothetical protein H9K75_14030 [Diaphorobacter aerolatus]